MLGIWNGEGIGRERGGGVQFTSNLGPRWTGSHHAKGGFPSTVSKRKWRGTNKKLARGVKKGELRHNLYMSICICVYNDWMNATNKLMCLGYK